MINRTFFWLFSCSLILLRLSESLLFHPPRILTTQTLYRTKIITHLSTTDFEDEGLSLEDVESLTIPQLKQQLRLRGLKVSGKKQELINRLLDFSGVQIQEMEEPVVEQNWNEDDIMEADVVSDNTSVNNKSSKSKAQKFAEERGKEFIDVTAYLDEDDKGKSPNHQCQKKLTKVTK